MRESEQNLSIIKDNVLSGVNEIQSSIEGAEKKYSIGFMEKSPSISLGCNNLMNYNIHISKLLILNIIRMLNINVITISDSTCKSHYESAKLLKECAVNFERSFDNITGIIRKDENDG